MNIQEAKQEVICSAKAYLAKEEEGNYRIPSVHQRPILLMGPPGIGKTAVMEQAARECGIGLLAYTMTHHTRQSAVGLPQLAERCYQGKRYTVTEYTMSEIVGSVYDYMEQTGYREGILFLDEINCVSETLAPAILQLLQFKTFGTHRLPEGWIVVAAGNPAEFNRSVRELDMAALDRVRTIEVEADADIWMRYAQERRIHPAVLSYLKMKPEHFYRVIQTRAKKEFVTARGWEDLSVVLKEYERQELTVGGEFMAEFLRSPDIASDFAAYYGLYRLYEGRYRIPELFAQGLSASEEKALQGQLSKAPADVKCIFVQHLLAAALDKLFVLEERARKVWRLQEVWGQLLSWTEKERKTQESFFENRARVFSVRKEHDLLKEGEESLERWVDEKARELLGTEVPEAYFDGEFRETEQERKVLCHFLHRMTDFLLETFGEGQELTDWLLGLQRGDYGSCGFERPELAGLTDRGMQEKLLRKKIDEMEALYETTDRI